jgi:hypothetical protein
MTSLGIALVSQDTEGSPDIAGCTLYRRRYRGHFDDRLPCFHGDRTISFSEAFELSFQFRRCLLHNGFLAARRLNYFRDPALLEVGIFVQKQYFL